MKAPPKIAEVCPELDAIRANLSFTESDSVAVIRRDNAIDWLPVFLRESDDAPHVRIYGVWHALDNLPPQAGRFERGLQPGRFERYESLRRKKLYDTSRNRMVEA